MTAMSRWLIAALACKAISGASAQALRGNGTQQDGEILEQTLDIKAAGPPRTALGYKGMTWPTTHIKGTGTKHIFAIGDWGGMDGSLITQQGRPRIISYVGGHTAGPHVFPRKRYNKGHTKILCNSSQFAECFNTQGQTCAKGCGFVLGVDTVPQFLVRDAMLQRAATSQPDYFLNVGDNFYWGGIEWNCGASPMNQLSTTAHHQFDQVYEGMYNGPLGSQPWFSVLGNHDWGGRTFFNGWDQQISYTWYSSRWVLPAPYYRTSVVYDDLGFSVDYFFLDSNMEDARGDDDEEHNLCSKKYNVYFDKSMQSTPVSCAAADGPPSQPECQTWFWNLWSEQQRWMEAQIATSTADWQIVVTHFPCGIQAEWFRMLHQKYGLDLLVTGHRHDQEMWANAPIYGGMTCFVTGGGGGITSESSPDPADKSDWYGEAQYGFYDMTISKDKILLQSINYDGTIVASSTVYPTAAR